MRARKSQWMWLIAVCLAGGGAVLLGKTKALANQNTASSQDGSTSKQDVFARALREATQGLNLNESEKKIFETEVLTNPFLFVLNYRSSSDLSGVQIDREKLKNYLKFSKAQLSMPPGPQSVCMSIRVFGKCEACAKAKPQASAYLSEQFLKRGFTTKQIDVFGAESTSSKTEAAEEYSAKVKQRGCGAIAYVELFASSEENHDDDEATSGFEAFAYFTASASQARHIKAQTTATSDTQNGSNWLSHVSAELFSQSAAQAGWASTSAETAEKILRVEGVFQYAYYVEFKRLVEKSLPELKIEERTISPGVFEFAFEGLALGEVARKLRNSTLKELDPPRHIDVVRMADQELTVVIR